MTNGTGSLSRADRLAATRDGGTSYAVRTSGAACRPSMSTTVARTGHGLQQPSHQLHSVASPMNRLVSVYQAEWCLPGRRTPTRA